MMAAISESELLPIETHPLEPFIPEGAKVMILGTFPPSKHRWSMNFYYPNRSNDFWFMMGLLFLGDRNALYDSAAKKFNLPAIKALLQDNKIALHDTCRQIRRLKGNASDKYLEVITPVPLYELLAKMPDCKAIVTTGEKAAQIISSITTVDVPGMGDMLLSPDGMEIWRMPSTSRAYPLALDKKARIYEIMFRHLGIL